MKHFRPRSCLAVTAHATPYERLGAAICLQALADVESRNGDSAEAAEWMEAPENGVIDYFIERMEER